MNAEIERCKECGDNSELCCNICKGCLEVGRIRSELSGFEYLTNLLEVERRLQDYRRTKNWWDKN